MRKALILIALICLAGCQSTGVFKDEKDNFKRVFGTEPPADVTVVHSALYAYNSAQLWNTNDYEFEIIAPLSWIESEIKRGHLEKGEWARKLAASRQSKRANDWYAPDPIDSYDCYVNFQTEIDYWHAMVEKKPQPDGRFRSFWSKH